MHPRTTGTRLVYTECKQLLLVSMDTLLSFSMLGGPSKFDNPVVDYSKMRRDVI